MPAQEHKTNRCLFNQGETLPALSNLMEMQGLPPYLNNNSHCEPINEETAVRAGIVQSHWASDGISSTESPMCKPDGTETHSRRMDKSPNYLGIKPKPDGRDYPAYYYSTPPGSLVQEVGAGLFSKYDPDGSGGEGLTVQTKHGVGYDQNDRFYLGHQANLSLAKARSRLSKNLYLNVDGISLQGGQSISSDGINTGASLNIASKGIEYNSSDPLRADDRNVKFGAGVSFPPIGGIRGHWSDDDRDGHREYGFGIDAGPISFDYKTEQPSDLLYFVNPGLGSLWRGAKDVKKYFNKPPGQKGLP